MSKRTLCVWECVCVSLCSTLTERDTLSFFCTPLLSKFFSLCLLKDVCKLVVMKHYEIRVDIAVFLKAWAFSTHKEKFVEWTKSDVYVHSSYAILWLLSCRVVGTLMKLHVCSTAAIEKLRVSSSHYVLMALFAHTVLWVKSNLRKFVCHTLLTFT